MSVSNLPLSQRNCKQATVWPRWKRVKLLKMCGYFSKEEMAERLGVTVDQLVSMVMRMQASYRVTKNPEDYKE